MNRNVLVTHADAPIGRRLIKALYYDDWVDHILAVGSGSLPRSFDRFLAGPKQRVSYARVDLARHRSMSDLFRSGTFRSAKIDSLIHLPAHGPPDEGPRVLAGLAQRTAEARLVLQHCLDCSEIRRLVAIGSACVYRLAPGNSNRFTEESELDLDPALPSEIRAWVDCDMIYHGEIHSDRLGVTLLRVPTVVASGGFVFLNPALENTRARCLRPMGFDPMCALISDKDLVRAARLSLSADAGGIFNVAGRESVPLSVLADWTGRGELALPGVLFSAASRALQLARGERARAAMEGPQLRYGFTLDTGRAERELGYRPAYCIEQARDGDGRLRLETAPL